MVDVIKYFEDFDENFAVQKNSYGIIGLMVVEELMNLNKQLENFKKDYLGSFKNG